MSAGEFALARGVPAPNDVEQDAAARAVGLLRRGAAPRLLLCRRGGSFSLRVAIVQYKQLAARSGCSRLPSRRPRRQGRGMRGMHLGRNACGRVWAGAAGRCHQRCHLLFEPRAHGCAPQTALGGVEACDGTSQWRSLSQQRSSPSVNLRGCRSGLTRNGDGLLGQACPARPLLELLGEGSAGSALASVASPPQLIRLPPRVLLLPPDVERLRTRRGRAPRRRMVGAELGRTSVHHRRRPWPLRRVDGCGTLGHMHRSTAAR
mmetsp:Transcript_5898/g.17731  ORF Transcript_5898/g.17731 Transcript_5898/m.17731 type:complete len:262 (-) Transcript_5898:438-1223(-)